MKLRLSFVIAGLSILGSLCSLGGCRSACSQDELRACSRVENGEAAAKVFGSVNPTTLRGELERCVECADGPGVRKALEAAKTIEGLLKRIRK